MSVQFDAEVVVVVDGALDGEGAPALYERISSACEARAETVLVDLSAVSGVDGGGVAVLAAAAHRARQAATTLLVQLPGGELLRSPEAATIRALLGRIDEL